jgi:hypothetical protein
VSKRILERVSMQVKWHFASRVIGFKVGTTPDGRLVELDENAKLWQLFTRRQQRELGVAAKVPLSADELAA